MGGDPSDITASYGARVSTFEIDSDDDLVARAKADGERDSRPFEVLVRRHQGHVVANCRILTRSSADAEDLAQEVFVKAFFGLRKFEGRSQFRTWLQRIKVNHCLNYLRQQRGTTVGIDELTVADEGKIRTGATADAELISAIERAQIVTVLDAMADTVRVPLMLRDGDGLSYEEIASTLNISLSAAKMRIKRGREEFRQRFAALTAPPGTSSSATP